MVICIGFLAKATPTGFVPNEDQGMTAVSIALPEGASSNRTQQIMAGLAQNMRKLPGVKNVMEVSGIDILSMGQKANAGLAVVTMEDYSKRSNSVQDVIPMISAWAHRFLMQPLWPSSRLLCPVLQVPVL